MPGGSLPSESKGGITNTTILLCYRIRQEAEALGAPSGLPHLQSAAGLNPERAGWRHHFEHGNRAQQRWLD